jgi:hypothetical protein
MGLVDSDMESFTLECCLANSDDVVFARDYGVE